MLCLSSPEVFAAHSSQLYCLLFVDNFISNDMLSLKRTEYLMGRSTHFAVVLFTEHFMVFWGRHLSIQLCRWRIMFASHRSSSAAGRDVIYCTWVSIKRELQPRKRMRNCPLAQPAIKFNVDTCFISALLLLRTNLLHLAMYYFLKYTQSHQKLFKNIPAPIILLNVIKMNI